MKKQKKKNGFTLAEVLITLVIIGVIAALTVPTLIQNTQKQEYVSALKKAYSTLSQAAQMIIAEEGSPKCSDGGWACSAKEIHDMFKKNLSYIQDCSESTANTDCLIGRKYKNIDGSIFGSLSDSQFGLVLADGAVVYLHQIPVNSCNGGNADDGSERDICAWFVVDINGKKAPNTAGRDLFWFVLKENGLYPRSCSVSDKCISSGFKQGHNCTCQVLREGAINY